MPSPAARGFQLSRRSALTRLLFEPSTRDAQLAPQQNSAQRLPNQRPSKGLTESRLETNLSTLSDQLLEDFAANHKPVEELVRFSTKITTDGDLTDRFQVVFVLFEVWILLIKSTSIMVTRSGSAARTLSLSLRTVTGKDLAISLHADASVLQLKEAVLARDGTAIATQRVTFLIRPGLQRTASPGVCGRRTPGILLVS